MSETERLIELVRERRFLYDLSDPDFKNRPKRMDAWEEIATEMGVGTANIWSSKWKGLKDNYAKYKKNSDPSFGQTYKKYKHWPWSEHMKFMDACTTSVKRIHYSQTNNTSEHTSTSENTSSSEQISETKFCQLYIPEVNPTTTSTEELLDPVPDGSESFTSESKKRKIKSKDPSEDVMEYLTTKINYDKPALDEVDHFFLSYAQSFKKLPNRMQIMLKLEIATLFSRYELQAEGVTKDSVDNITRIVPHPVKCEYDVTNTIED